MKKVQMTPGLIWGMNFIVGAYVFGAVLTAFILIAAFL